MNCIILHGCSRSPGEAKRILVKEADRYWIFWVRRELERRGVEAATPTIPEHWKMEYEIFKREFEKLRVDEETVLVGHSCTTAFLVRWLGESGRRVKKLILVAPWKFPESVDLFNFEVDEGIRKRVGEIVFFTSDNESELGKRSLEIFHRALDGEVIELPGRGHYDPGEMGPEFPELLEVILR